MYLGKSFHYSIPLAQLSSGPSLSICITKKKYYFLSSSHPPSLPSFVPSFLVEIQFLTLIHLSVWCTSHFAVLVCVTTDMYADPSRG